VTEIPSGATSIRSIKQPQDARLLGRVEFVPHRLERPENFDQNFGRLSAFFAVAPSGVMVNLDGNRERGCQHVDQPRGRRPGWPRSERQVSPKKLHQMRCLFRLQSIYSPDSTRKEAVSQQLTPELVS
jgi:hypothetical protein